MADSSFPAVLPTILHLLKNDPTYLISVSIFLVAFHAAYNYTRSHTLSAHQPSRPPMIGWVPWIGSVFDYMFHPLTFFKSYSNKHGLAFRFKLFGQTFIAISSPTAVSNLLRDRTGTFDVVNGQNIHLLTGLSGGKDRAAHLYSAMLTKAAPPLNQALTASRLPAIASRWTEELLKILQRVDSKSPAPHHSLNEFLRHSLYDTASLALMGGDFPLGTYDAFMKFDQAAALYVRHLGAFAGADEARDSMFDTWSQHMEDHWVSDNDGYLVGAADLMSDVYRVLKQTDLNPREVNRLTCVMLWSMHSNVMDLAVWVLCHILTDQAIYTRVCQEIRSFVKQHFPNPDDLVRMDPRLLDSEAFVFLNSVVQEVMRTKAAVGPLRIATKDAVLMGEGNKEILIRKGEMIELNFQGMHHSPILQDDPEVFKADRYVENAPSYNSYIFGAGKHMCAGRNYAKFAVRQFVLLLLTKYDVRVHVDPAKGITGTLPEEDGKMGINVMLFSRQRNDLLITFHPASLD